MKEHQVEATEVKARPLLMFITADRLLARFYQPATDFHRWLIGIIPPPFANFQPSTLDIYVYMCVCMHVYVLMIDRI